MKLGIIGAGFSGRAIAVKAVTKGAHVWGTTRDETKATGFAEDGFAGVVFDGQTVTEPLLSALHDTTHLVISIAPARQENRDAPDGTVDPTLAALGERSLSTIAPSLQWVGYLSTVGVYGNHDGAWVDELTPVAPASERSRQRVRAEAEWMAVDKSLDMPVGIFRLSGIYGPGRNALLTAERGKARRLVKKDQVFNRIHACDIAQALWLAAEQKAGGLFNITDDEPAPPQDVVAYAHDLMGKQAPPEMDFETAELTPMARSFYGENKRVSNAKSKEVLGLEYDWPNYRTALKRMWDEDCWRRS
ncbi:MAG: SDR family oxidoreductase [Pseudomonadota bacterium]